MSVDGRPARHFKTVGRLRLLEVWPALWSGTETTVLLDILIAVVIVVIAAVLGLVVHPLLWIVIIVAVLWLFFRRSRW